MKSFSKDDLVVKLTKSVDMFQRDAERSQYLFNKKGSTQISTQSRTPCICGCNTPMLLAKRNPRIQYTTPKNNFLSLLEGFLRDSRLCMPSYKIVRAGEYDIYDLFHCILKVRRHFGRLSWRAVQRTLGLDKADRELKKSLKLFYRDYLADFEKWIFDKGPVTVGCIDTQVVLTVLREFVPGFVRTKAGSPLRKEAESTIEGESSNEDLHEEPLQDVVDFLAHLISMVEELAIIGANETIITLTLNEQIGIKNVENSKIENEEKMFKQRKLYADLPDLDGLIEEPIFKVERVEVKPEAILKKKNKTRICENPTEVKKEEKTNQQNVKNDKLTLSAKKEIKKPKQKRIEKIDIPNPMTPEFRCLKSTDMGFRTDFISRYLPIEMQENALKEEKKFNEEKEKESRTHFIRKKQSAVNIKRSCGVTYVLPTESKQEGVDDLFPPLPSLAFQVGTIDRLIPSDERSMYSDLAKSLIKSLFASEGVTRATVQKNYGENDLKKYILGELPDGEEIMVADLSSLWRLMGKDNFVVLHLNMDQNSLLAPSLPSKRGDVFLGFLVKKGLCGMRSVKRCLGLEDLDTDPLNIYASQMRLELYVTKQAWKIASSRARKLLCAFIYEFEAHMQHFLLDWNANREKIYKSKSFEPMKGLHSWAKLCNCELPPLHTKPTNIWYQSTSETKKNKLKCENCGSDNTKEIPFYQSGLTEVMESKNPPNWFYLINTRDSFSYDLKVKKTKFVSNGREILKKEFYFRKNDLPSNYHDWQKYQEGDLVRTGIVTYHNCFSQEQLKKLEEDAQGTEDDFRKGHFLMNTAQPSYGAGGIIKRTKFFFGSRYMWTATQLAERQSKIAAGVRVDVSSTPFWMKKGIVNPLEDAGIIEKDFINSIAMNIYHDGKEGLAQHFDDAVRFKQPIFTVKLGSDARLSFGSQFYGYLNGAFCIPCPRGVVCVMEEFSYAANSAKHCVRPCDLSGRSITLILRQIHPFIMEEAKRYDIDIDLPT